MINWIKYDPENPPEKGMYLVSHIGGVTSANIKAEGWQSYNGHWLFDVTHYAPINLQGRKQNDYQLGNSIETKVFIVRVR
ncbi:hypothetical protein M3664_04940 [Paenibacillus lautus]|uniref:hypothetical protein n=1 Tax=Paenibacillus lautus TaxID=1401 RepID=UPI002041626B|nr:hypothetical protein [Paenibacillus lautus]MCM3257129.1 hypothetical protein [Paenibacillus lautus]